MRWLILDGRKRNAVLLCAAVVVAFLLGWTAWNGLHRNATGTLRPIRYGDSAKRDVALTFDVGRGGAEVGAVLAELKASRAAATFFVSDEWARANGNLLRQMIADGHTVEASGHAYIDMSGLGREQAASELRRVSETIGSIAGVSPVFFRPPGGKCSDALLEAAINSNLIPVTWTVDSQDWRVGSASAIAKRVSVSARPGAIILLHAGDEASHTAASLGEMVTLLRQAGLEPVTLRALLADEDSD